MKLVSAILICAALTLGGCGLVTLPASMYLSGVFIEASGYLPSEEIAGEELEITLKVTQLQVDCLLQERLGFLSKDGPTECGVFVHDDPLDVVVTASVLLSFAKEALDESWYPQFSKWVTTMRKGAEEILSFEVR